MSCTDTVCGTGGWNGPKPGDPDNNLILSATPAFGGIDVSWTYPSTYPEAVAHILLYRGVSADFNTAIQINVVTGTFYYDKLDNENRYYYWIRMVSVNGTIYDLVGPASATARRTIAQTIEQLTGLIDAGVLAQSLKAEIDKITLNYQELTTEIANRIASNAALSAALADVQSGVAESLAFVNEEITVRKNGQDALVSQLNTVAAVNASNAAAILEERTARVTADSSLANQITTVAAAAAANAAAVTQEQTARVSATTALANSITTTQTTLNGNIASVRTGLESSITVVNGRVVEIGALYTAKVTVNGLIGGFGIYNNGQEVDAGFDVDRFWIGRTGSNKRKPFIIATNPATGLQETFIDDAVINKLTFSKLRDESGSFIVENGKVKADYLNVRQITGGAFTDYVWPSAELTGFYLGPSGLLMGNYNRNPGTPPAYVQITSDGSFYAPGMQIVNGVLSINQINVIDTLNIRGNAVTIPQSVYSGGAIAGVSSITAQTLVIYSTGAPAVITFGAHIYSTHHETLIMHLARDGVSLFSVGGGDDTTQVLGEGMQTASIIDTPGAGYHTYVLTVGSPGYNVHCSARCITYLEVKK